MLVAGAVCMVHLGWLTFKVKHIMVDDDDNNN